VPLDIRLRTRVVPGNVDMGAFEKGGPCPADIDGSDEVDAEDLLTLLAAWGSCPGPCPPSCAGDFDADCQVGTTDLLELLASWGYCDEPFAPSPPQSVVDCLDRYGSDPAKAAACIEAMILAGTP